MNDFGTYENGPLTHLTAELMQGYRDKSLSPELMDKVAAYLQQNPFEGEAMEGLNRVDGVQMNADLSDLQARIEGRTMQQQSKPFMWWRIAAVVALFAVSALVWYINWPQIEPKDSLAIEQEVVEPEAETLANKSLGKDESFRAADQVEARDEKEENRLSSNESEAERSFSPSEAASETATAARELQESIAEGEFSELAETANFDDDNEDYAALADEEVSEPRSAAPSLITPQDAYQSDAVALSDSFDIPYEYKVVVGKVISQTGSPIAGANVVLKGTGLSTFSDRNGFFHFEAPVSAQTLVGNSSGYTSPEVPIGDQAQINVVVDQPVADQDQNRAFLPRAKSKKAEEDNLGAASSLSQPSKAEAKPQSSLAALPPNNLGGYLQRNTVYPSRAQSLNVQGVVVVEFTVLPNGRLTDFQIVQKLGFGCDEAAVEALQNGPLWQAASQDGQPVPSQAQTEVHFPPEQQ